MFTCTFPFITSFIPKVPPNPPPQFLTPHYNPSPHLPTHSCSPLFPPAVSWHAEEGPFDSRTGVVGVVGVVGSQIVWLFPPGFKAAGAAGRDISDGTSPPCGLECIGYNKGFASSSFSGSPRDWRQFQAHIFHPCPRTPFD